MIKKSKILTVLILCLFSFGFVLNQIEAQEKSSEKALKIGKKAPSFETKTIEGNKLNIKKLKGNVVLLDFWASWCPPCRKEIPHLQEAYDQFHDDGLKIVSVNVNEDKEAIDEFTSDVKMPWTHVLNPEGKISALYNVRYIPASFLIDHTGKLVAADEKLRGDNLLKTIKKYVEQIPEDTDSENSKKVD